MAESLAVTPACFKCPLEPIIMKPPKAVSKAVSTPARPAAATACYRPDTMTRRGTNQTPSAVRASPTQAIRKQAQDQVKNNKQTIEILSVDQYVDAWKKKTGKRLKDITDELKNKSAEDWTRDGKTASSYVSTALDLNTARRLLQDLGVRGRIALKTVGNKQYVIFKGLPNTRTIFTGTRYLANNAKVVDMAVGRLGTAKSVVKGGRLTVFLVVPINILIHLLDEQSTLSTLVGTTITDVAKVGIATVLAGMAAGAAVSATTIAAGPILAAIAVGVAASMGLEALDQHFGLTEAFCDVVEKTATAVRDGAQTVKEKAVETYEKAGETLQRAWTKLEKEWDSSYLGRVFD